MLPGVEVWSINHWTARGSPRIQEFLGSDYPAYHNFHKAMVRAETRLEVSQFLVTCWSYHITNYLNHLKKRSLLKI